MMSDAECTPTLPGGKKEGVRRPSKTRQPRRIIEYSEPESADDDVKAAPKEERKVKECLFYRKIVFYLISVFFKI